MCKLLCLKAGFGNVKHSLNLGCFDVVVSKMCDALQYLFGNIVRFG